MNSEKFTIFSVLLIIFSSNRFVNGKAEASPKLMTLIESEKMFLTMLKEVSDNMEESVREIKSYVTSTLEIYNNSRINYEEFLSHPINSYLLTRRTVIDVKRLERVINKPQELFAEALKLYRTYDFLPSQEAYEMAVDGLVSIQQTYNLDSKYLAKGLIKSPIFKNHPDVKAESLEAVDCQWLIIRHMNRNNTDMVKEWVDIGTRLTKGETFETDLEQEVIDSKSESIIAPELFTNDLTHQEEIYQYHRLCRGEKLLPKSVERLLVCFNYPGKNAYFLLQPIKVEEASVDPYIVVFRDVINDVEIKTLQDLAKDKLRAALGILPNGTSQLSSARISYTAFVPSQSNEVTRSIAKKLESLIGLEINDSKGSSEEFQVNNYGTGGLYYPHNDYFPEDERVFALNNMGNRMATFMYYLSDVPAGGATVFPYAGVSVFPEKGSAVFWWNLKSNGDGDVLTKHAGCPVLYGTKWVTNMWIRSNAQMFRKPCDLVNDEIYYEL